MSFLPTLEDGTSVQDALFLPGDTVRIRDSGICTLIGSACRDCGWKSFPPAQVCGACASEDLAEDPMPEVGSVYSVTTLHVGPPMWNLPMTLGYVDFENGVRVFGHMERLVGIGDAVRPLIQTVGKDPKGTPINSFVFVRAEG